MLDTVLEVSWTADQRHLVAAGGDQALRMWEISSGRVRHTLTGHTGKVIVPWTLAIYELVAVGAQYPHPHRPHWQGTAHPCQPLHASFCIFRSISL